MDLFLNGYISDEDVEESALQAELSVAVTLDHLLRLAGDYDTAIETSTLRNLYTRIKQRFDKEYISPEATTRTELLRTDRTDALNLITRSEKGYVFSRMRELLSASIKRQTLQGPSIPEYFYLFRYYFKHEIHRIGSNWEVVFDDAFSKPEVIQDVTEKVSTNERDKAVKLLQHYGEQLEVKVDGDKTQLKVLGDTLEVAKNRIEEDKRIWSTVQLKQREGALPFYEEEILDGSTFYTLHKTYNFITQHLTKDSQTVTEDDSTVTVEILSLKDPVKIGDGHKWITLRAKPPHSGKSMVTVTGSEKVLPLVYSTDLSALVQKKSSDQLVIIQNENATIENVSLLMPSRRDLLPYSCSISCVLTGLIGHGRKVVSENWSMYRFVRSFFQKPRTLAQLEMTLSLLQRPFVRSLGKYCALIGITRLQIDKVVMWVDTTSSEDVFVSHLYALERGERGEEMLSKKYGERALQTYKDIEAAAKGGSLLIDPTFYLWARGHPSWPDDRHADRGLDAERVLELVGLDSSTAFEVLSRAVKTYPQENFNLAAVTAALDDLVETGHVAREALGWRISYTRL